ncbi:zinc-binding alcohol dehydrogenase family protein [Metabacillus sp. JX24]|uniref:zinc-binding alcohol dehydrogenase family protein n=1 Tax=Metabacillus sp. JX24 TaxID=3240759 RepID=UPI00350FC739
MKAVGLYKYLPIEHEESLIDLEMEKPKPQGRDLLVEVKAISINPVDTKVRAPKDQTEETPKILGWDASGIVVECGPECTDFKPGDEVYYAGSITRQGSYSEFQLVDERITGRKPANLSFPEAAALPLTAITAYEGLFDRMGIDPDDRSRNQQKSVLIIGGAGGVGSIAVQLAKWAGLHVIATASREETVKWVKEHGADAVINHHHPMKKQIEDLSLADPDYIFCLNNTDQHWEGMSEIIKPQGTVCSIVENKEPLDLNLLKNKSAAFVWEFMFTRAMFETEDMDQQQVLLNRISKLIEDGALKTTVNETLSPINADNLKKAHEKIESGNTIGKIVLQDF